MKAFWTILILTVFSTPRSERITQDHLIGKWIIVNARITNPIYCGQWDPELILNSRIEFTSDGILILTSKNGLEWTNRTKPISWRFEGNKLTIRSSSTVKPQVSEITCAGNTYFFRFTNMVEIGMEKE